MSFFGKLSWWHHALAIKTLITVIFFTGVFIMREMPFSAIGANMFVADINVSGLNYNEVTDLLNRRTEQLKSQSIEIKTETATYQVPLSELGVEINLYKTAENIYLAEYGENFWENSQVLLKSFFKKRTVEPVFVIDEARWEAGMKTHIPELKDPKNATVKYIKGKFQVIPEQDGKTAELTEPKKILEQSLKNFQTSALTLTMQTVPAEITAQEITPATTQAQVHVEQPFIFKFEEGKKEYEIRFSREWINFEHADAGGIFSTIREDKLKNHLTQVIAPEIDIAAQNATLTAIPQEKSDYAIVKGVAKNGRRVNITQTLSRFYEAIDKGEHTAALVVLPVEGKIFNETGQDLGKLEWLSTGKSNFKGSPAGRDFNVRKGLNEKVSNILLAPGAVYDFNKNLGPVTNSAGWKDSLAIFGGKDLRPVPGGGLCQVATTVYRAAVHAGLPILERSNHSLYVHYYTDYGDGLDAAIYPGQKNLKFENNTNAYMLIQAYDDGMDAVVNVYGTDDNRTIALDGPFYPKSIPAEWKEKIKLNSNQIGWYRMVRNADGTIAEERQLTGTYRSIPY